MTRLGSLRGNGELFSKQSSLGPAHYEIDVWQDGPHGLKKAQGKIQANDGAIFTAFQNRETTLALSDGQIISINVRQFFAGTGEAQIDVSGPVPGF